MPPKMPVTRRMKVDLPQPESAARPITTVLSAARTTTTRLLSKRAALRLVVATLPPKKLARFRLAALGALKAAERVACGLAMRAAATGALSVVAEAAMVLASFLIRQRGPRRRAPAREACRVDACLIHPRSRHLLG